MRHTSCYRKTNNSKPNRKRNALHYLIEEGIASFMTINCSSSVSSSVHCIDDCSSGFDMTLELLNKDLKVLDTVIHEREFYGPSYFCNWNLRHLQCNLLPQYSEQELVGLSL